MNHTTPIWTEHEITVWVSGAEADGQQVSINGYAKRKNSLWHWSAMPNAFGWMVITYSPSSRVESFQGSTFNLALEVASALGRAL